MPGKAFQSSVRLFIYVVEPAVVFGVNLDANRGHLPSPGTRLIAVVFSVR
jgi:hypothetical protein